MVEVPTLEGRINLRIPEGTQSHKVFRIKGKALPRAHDDERRLVMPCGGGDTDQSQQ